MVWAREASICLWFERESISRLDVFVFSSRGRKAKFGVFGVGSQSPAWQVLAEKHAESDGEAYKAPRFLDISRGSASCKRGEWLSLGKKGEMTRWDVR